MNEAKTLLDAGDLKGATDAALAIVKANPTNIAARTFLFELAIFAGDWDRAKRQLDVIGHQNANSMIGSLIYEQCMLAEKKRADVFGKGAKPEFLSTPPDHIYGLLSANNRIREGKFAEAREILDEIESNRKPLKCVVNGVEADDFRDASDPTAYVLEVIIKDSYVWVPFEQIEKIGFEPASTQRDAFWRKGALETESGTNGEIFVPALYNESWKSGDDDIRLGRAADWRDLGEDIYAGDGGKVFAVGGEYKSIMALQTIEFIKE